MSISDPIPFTGTAWQAGPSSVGEPCVLLKLGEVVLKGRNRHQFEKMQQRNIKAAVKDTGLPTEVLHREGVVLVRVPREGRTPEEHAAAVETVAQRTADVPGIIRVCRAWRVEKTPEAAIAAAVELTRGATGTFAVRPRRRDKRFPVTSAELAVTVGR